MKSLKKNVSLALLAATAAVAVGSAAQAQVAGLASIDKIKVVMGTKAFKDGYNAIRTQNTAQLNRMEQLQTEVDALSKPLDSNGDGQLSEQDQAWIAALQERDKIIKSLDANKDNNLTGTELDALRARNLPVQNIIEKQRELSIIEENIKLAQLYVVDSIEKQYDGALKSVVTSKKINAVLAPGAFEWAPPETDISGQVIAVLDRTVPAVALPAPEKFSTSQEAINLRAQIEQIVINNAVAQARAQQMQQQQGGQPGQPAAPAPAPAPQPDEGR